MAITSDDDYFPKEEKPPEPPKEAEEPAGKKKKYSTIDGPRYTVGLQDEKDKSCYKDFFETEKLGEAKEKAAEGMAKYGRACIVFDRIGCPGIIHREIPAKDAEPMVAGKVSDAKKKKKK